MSIDLIVDIAVTPGHMSDALDGFRELVARTRDERGCSRFDLLVPEGTSDTLLLIETWDDQAAIDLHMQQDYTSAFVSASPAFLAAAPRARRAQLVAV